MCPSRGSGEGAGLSRLYRLPQRQCPGGTKLKGEVTQCGLGFPIGISAPQATVTQTFGEGSQFQLPAPGASEESCCLGDHTPHPIAFPGAPHSASEPARVPGPGCGSSSCRVRAGSPQCRLGAQVSKLHSHHILGQSRWPLRTFPGWASLRPVVATQAQAQGPHQAPPTPTVREHGTRAEPWDPGWAEQDQRAHRVQCGEDRQEGWMGCGGRGPGGPT